MQLGGKVKKGLRKKLFNFRCQKAVPWIEHLALEEDWT